MRLLTILCLVLLSVHSYSQDVVTGPFLIRDGVMTHQDTNEPVTGIVEMFYPNDQLQFRVNYIDGELDGLWEYFDEDGQLHYRENYKDGKQDGLWEFFYENGQLQFRVNFKDGKEDGLWERFDKDGNLIETRTYRNGELVETY